MNTIKKESSKSIRKKFIKYLLPSISAMWIFSLYTIVDGIFVSRGVGPTALAAINMSMPFISFIFAISLLLSTGASTLIAIYLGKNNIDKSNKIFTQHMVTIIIVSLSILIISILNLDKLILFLGATKATFPYIKDYMKIIVLFNGFFIISYSLEVIVKTDGFPHFAIIGVSISAIMNIVLDYIFVIRLGYGISGAAYATGISQLAGSIFYIVHFIKKNSRLNFVKFKFDFSIFKRILLTGFPDCITELSSGIVIFLFNHTILTYIGEHGVIAYSIVSYINILVLNTMIGITQGMQPLSSYYYGKDDKKLVLKLFKMSFKTITIVSLATFAFVMLFTESIVSIFIDNSNKELFYYSIKVFRVFSISFLFVGFNVNISGFFASIERPLRATIISLGRGLVIITGSLYFMTHIWGAKGIWFSTTVSEIICLILSFLILKKLMITNKKLVASN